MEGWKQWYVLGRVYLGVKTVECALEGVWRGEGSGLCLGGYMEGLRPWSVLGRVYGGVKAVERAWEGVWSHWRVYLGVKTVENIGRCEGSGGRREG